MRFGPHALLETQRLPVLLNPADEFRPLPQERLVSHLDDGIVPRRASAVGHQQPRLFEGVHQFARFRVLIPRRAARSEAGRSVVLIHAHQPGKDALERGGAAFAELRKRGIARRAMAPLRPPKASLR